MLILLCKKISHHNLGGEYQNVMSSHHLSFSYCFSFLPHILAPLSPQMPMYLPLWMNHVETFWMHHRYPIAFVSMETVTMLISYFLCNRTLLCSGLAAVLFVSPRDDAGSCANKCMTVSFSRSSRASFCSIRRISTSSASSSSICSLVRLANVSNACLRSTSRALSNAYWYNGYPVSRSEALSFANIRQIV